MQHDHEPLRADLVRIMQEMDRVGLNHGTAGNASVRIDGGLLITPTGIPAAQLTPESIVAIDENGTASGETRPSSEWRMHLGVLAARRDVDAIVHCHSRYATAVACTRRELPALHYMVAATHGRRVPIAPYATFGSTELAEHIVTTLGQQRGCLMANHGQIAIAPTLSEALTIAREIEEQAFYYCTATMLGGAHALSDDEMDDVLSRFADYGQRKPRP